MSYMSTQQAAKIRSGLKAAFPAKDGWKLSVRKSSGSLGIDVTFLAGPHHFVAYDYHPYHTGVIAPEDRDRKTVTHSQINEYHYEEHYAPASAAVIKKALDVIMEDHWDKSDIQSDYFHCAFYLHVAIGEYDKPYACTL